MKWDFPFYHLSFSQTGAQLLGLRLCFIVWLEQTGADGRKKQEICNGNACKAPVFMHKRKKGKM